MTRTQDSSEQATPASETHVVWNGITEKLWCESCGEAEQTVHLDHAGLCYGCANQQGDEE